jgi:predicted DNA-binding WGR domain protein
MSAIILHRTDPAKNMCRFYRLDLQPDLFGQWCFIRVWGRIGRAGQVRMVPYATAAEAHEALALQQRIARRSQKMALYPAVEPAHRLFGLWSGRTARGSGGRNNRRGIRIWNRSRVHYLRVHAFRWLDDTTAFIQFLAETLVSIRGRVSILRASLGGARQILLWNCLITSRITRRNLRHGSSAS